MKGSAAEKISVIGRVPEIKGIKTGSIERIDDETEPYGWIFSATWPGQSKRA